MTTFHRNGNGQLRVRRQRHRQHQWQVVGTTGHNELLHGPRPKRIWIDWGSWSAWHDTVLFTVMERCECGARRERRGSDAEKRKDAAESPW